MQPSPPGEQVEGPTRLDAVSLRRPRRIVAMEAAKGNDKESSSSSTSSNTYWQQTSSAPLERPDPSVSNCGLVIVQVDRDDVYRPPAVVKWQPAQEQVNNNHGEQHQQSSAAHQLIHGLPPTVNPATPAAIPAANQNFLPSEEDDDEDEVGSGSDEGYRTHNSSTSSPRSSTASEEGGG